MAGLRELKSRLASIQTVGQLSGAMRTVSAAKYSRVGRARREFAPYAQGCRDMMARFGPELSAALPRGNPEAQPCYVVMAGNRGLCGGYNIELLNFAREQLSGVEEPYLLLSVGKKAESSLREWGFPLAEAVVLPDVPDFEGCRELISRLKKGYTDGEFSSLFFIYQKFNNMMSQEPVMEQILPLSAAEAVGETETLLLPDRSTVLSSAGEACVDAVLFDHILEAAAGAQAATLVAMRTSYDNAQESIAELETQISRQRQSAITSGVLETAVETE